MEKIEKLFPNIVTPIIRENAALAQAPAYGKPVIQYAPRSHGAEDYRLVAKWLTDHGV